MPKLLETIRCDRCGRTKVYDVDTDTREGFFEGPMALAKLDGWRWDRDERRTLCPPCVELAAPHLTNAAE